MAGRARSAATGGARGPGAPPGWEIAASGPQAFHPDVLAHEEQHPLRGWGTDVAITIVSHLKPLDAARLSQANRHLRASTSGTDTAWKEKIADLSEQRGDEEMAVNEDEADLRAAVHALPTRSLSVRPWA
jgi:hypothetical protein